MVVDASGLGARLLAEDRSVTPVRGQVLYVEQVGLDRWWLDSAGLTYVVPRAHEIVVGGTDEEGRWNLTPDPAVAARILARASALVPALAGARVLRHKVGLRPGRPAVRLEEERVGSTRVVHCYGHGGAGVTLSWGCAADVAAPWCDLRRAAGSGRRGRAGRRSPRPRRRCRGRWPAPGPAA